MSLHTNGYVIHRGAIPINNDLHKSFDAMTSGQAHLVPKVIFNNKKRGGDKKRLQMPLTASNGTTLTKMFHKSFMTFAETNYPDLIPNDMVILTSRPGCQQQLPHCDYEPTYEFATTSDAQVPLGCLVAVEPGTKLCVWPNSIRLSILAPELLTKWLEEHGPIDMKIIELRPGDVLVFRGDLIHAGAEYTQGNNRVHMYLDSPVVERQKNRTWFPDPSIIA